MMKYRVINAFNDIYDNLFLYSVGDAYPREGTQPSEGRISELLSDKNKQGKPLIEAIGVESAENAEKPLKKKRGKRNDDD